MAQNQYSNRRYDDVFMNKGSSNGQRNFADYFQSEVAGLKRGGMFGYGKQWKYWINNHQYTSRPLITFLVEAPVGFKLLADGDNYISILRSLVETVRHKVTGLQAKITVNVEENQPFGGSGQKYQVFTNVTEAVPDVTMSFFERPGLAIGRFFRFWIEMLMMNPETKFASISTLSDEYLKSGVNIKQAYDAMPDMYSMSMLFIEPDVTHTKVVQSWLGINMFPKDSGDNEAQHDKENPSSTRELSIGFTGIYQYGPGVDKFAQKVLNSISLIGANVWHEAIMHNPDFKFDSSVTDKQDSYTGTVTRIKDSQENQFSTDEIGNNSEKVVVSN